jgi:hypothetical protein
MGVEVGRGEANCTTNVVGMGEGVGSSAEELPRVSAKARDIPPITINNMIAPKMNPPPAWAMDFIFISPSQHYL